MPSFKKILSKLIKPLGLVGVSTTMVACYGVPADEPYSLDDYCEEILIQSCGQEDYAIPEKCAYMQDERDRICN